MKTFRLISFASIALFVTSAFAQQTATLACDIEALRDGSKPAEVCHFVENPDSNPELFTIEAEVGEEIIWSGEDSILIRKVKHYGGTNIFDQDPEGDGEIIARPNKKTNGKPYRYKLKFRLEGSNKQYKIDPIIRSK